MINYKYYAIGKIKKGGHIQIYTKYMVLVFPYSYYNMIANHNVLGQALSYYFVTFIGSDQ